jgi:hypothetical protein
MADNVVVKKESAEDIEFFGDIDKNKHGNLASEMPSWYFRQHKDELKGNIDSLAASLERGEIVDDKKPGALAELAKMREKMDKINESEPRIKDKQKDVLDKTSEELGKKIAGSMFTRSDMMKGVADAHEEARRMADPCIPLSGAEVDLAKKAGCKISRDGQVSRTDAERVWKLCRRALGENSNTEILRRP